MGRIFEVRKATMFARWDKMAKLFTRVAKEITMAVKAGGPSPDSNPALRRAIQNARAANMPKDKVDTAIKRASGQADIQYHINLYEGYAAHGVPVIVESASDNPVRTVSNVRRLFKDHGGNLGATGSVSFMFKQMGVFRLSPEGLDLESLELDLIDHGLEEMGESVGEKGEKIIVVRCLFKNFGLLQAAIEARKITPLASASEYIPENFVELPNDQATEVLELIDALEQDDDVQHVFHNLK
ncbi:YebC/PmpR family DNA-binding transcriptional regulator [bacterium]|nr:YebC/PmpR family DNA-binding transcriptional regulator [bacterium]